MAPARLSRLQRSILAWLWAPEQRVQGTMAASHAELGQALRYGNDSLKDGPLEELDSAGASV